QHAAAAQIDDGAILGLDHHAAVGFDKPVRAEDDPVATIVHDASVEALPADDALDDAEEAALARLRIEDQRPVICEIKPKGWRRAQRLRLSVLHDFLHPVDIVTLVNLFTNHGWRHLSSAARNKFTSRRFDASPLL